MNNSMSRLCTIGKLAEATGCKKETVRYYEKIGLLMPPPRTEGGHRLYAEEDVKRLTFIRRIRELGFTIEQVRELLALVDGGKYTCTEIRRFTLKQVEAIREKISDLKKMETSLMEMASRCSDKKVPDCAIIDALYPGKENIKSK